MIPQRNLSLLSNRLARAGGRRIPEAVLERDYLPGLRGPATGRPGRQGGEGGHDDPRGRRLPHRGAPRSARLSRIQGPARGREGQGLLAPRDGGGEGGGPPRPSPERAPRPLRPLAPRRALTRGPRSGRSSDYPEACSPESGTRDPPWSAPAKGTALPPAVDHPTVR